MDIGISTASFFMKAVTEDSFELIRSCGASIAEVFLTTYSEYTSKFSELLASRKGDITVHSVHTLNSQFEPQLFNGAARTRADAERIFLDVLQSANVLGAKYYTFHGQARLKRFKEYVIDFDKLASRMCELTEVAEQFGVTVSYENVHWALYNYAGFFHALKAKCSSLAATLDIKQAFQSHADYRDYMIDMGRSISTVHVCDYDANGNLLPIGKGCFDFKELFHRLWDVGINPPVLIELYSGDYADFDEVSESVEYLKNIR